MRKILFVTSEAHPLIKTGGLADVSGSLPPALSKLNCDVRVLLPFYREISRKLPETKQIAQFSVGGLPGTITIREMEEHEPNLKTWFVDYPAAFDRPGNPYLAENGEPWEDNAERFSLFCKAACLLATGQLLPDWQCDLVHCNDWQSGLVPALLAQQQNRPATLFTIHNLAYQGLFSHDKFKSLVLPEHFWSPQALEFHNQFSFIKGGLVYADLITTVSPTYAQEIQTEEFGYGLEGLLSHRQEQLSGILNGIDMQIWNPATDAALAKNYGLENIKNKKINKQALQHEFSLPEEDNIPLVGMVGRLVYQKGIDLVLDVLPDLCESQFQLVLLGSGDKKFEQALLEVSQQYQANIAVSIGYDEAQAHRIEAGADMFLMPSRFEPCGLNQLYSLRYGTVPIVGNVGGLFDSIVDLNVKTQKDKSATGFIIDTATPECLLKTLERAFDTYKKPRIWSNILKTGMQQDFSWEKSAAKYLQLYEHALNM